MIDFEEVSVDFLEKLEKREFIDEECPEVEVELCEHCGACEDPKHCVWSVQCPECFAPPRQQCTAPNGGLTGLHEKRHKYANSPFWQSCRS